MSGTHWHLPCGECLFGNHDGCEQPPPNSCACATCHPRPKPCLTERRGRWSVIEKDDDYYADKSAYGD